MRCSTLSGPGAHGHRLVGWQRLLLMATGSVLLSTGGFWLAVHYLVGAGAGAGAGQLPHPAEAWLVRLHGAAAIAGVFMFGLLAAVHIPWGLQFTRRIRGGHRLAGQRRSGIWLCALAAALVASGYALYYFAPEALRPTLGWGHSAFGVVMAVLVGRHRRGLRTPA